MDRAPHWRNHRYDGGVTTAPRAFFTQDTGAATIATALVGRVGSRWRLIGSLCLPIGSDPAALVALLVERVIAADPSIAVALGLDRTPPDEIPKVEVTSHPAPRLAVIAGSERALAPLVAAAARSGWRTSAASAEAVDPLQMSTILLDPGVDGILAGAGEPPAADERRALGELGALVAAAAARRPDIPVVLAGGMAIQLGAFGESGRRPAPLLLASAASGGPRGGALREVLTDLALPRDDARRTLGGAANALSDLLDRRIDIVDIGFDGATRAAAWPTDSSVATGMDLAVVPTAGLAPAEPDDEVVDRVADWSPGTTDRHRLRDRLRELRIAPWADAAGDGVRLRLAAVRSALSLLDQATPEWIERPAADLLIATGGVWSGASPASALLAIIDVLRRHGVVQIGMDHARLLAPLGSIADLRERRAIVADLLDDVLLPLGTVVMPAGQRQDRNPGTLVLHGNHTGDEGDRARDGKVDLVNLEPGGLASIWLAPGASSVAEFRFHDAVRLGGRGRHFAIDVTGGLVGLVVDLRGVPLKLPDRADLRHDLLETWGTAVRVGAA